MAACIVVAIGIALVPHKDYQEGRNDDNSEEKQRTSLLSTYAEAMKNEAAGMPLDESIESGANYLINACGDDGQFVYRINVDPNIRPSKSYNVLRHAGTMYSLAMYHRWKPDDKAVAAIERAAKFLNDRCIEPLKDQPELSAVWSRPELNYDEDDPTQAKLGAAGLALIALTSLEQIKPGSTDIEQLRAIGRFIVYLQKQDGSFHCKYIPSLGGRQDDWVSLYYPGEAALGMVMLYEHDSNPQWLQCAANAIAYLARSRESESDVPADHWALLATAKMLPHYDKCEQPVPRDRLVGHAVQICKSILDDMDEAASAEAWSVLRGCLTGDGHTTPTATRMEGLLAALTFIPAKQSDLRLRMVDAVENGIGFLCRAQIAKGGYRGAITRAVLRTSINDERATEVRIDYVQHALIAMIQYWDYHRMSHESNKAG